MSKGKSPRKRKAPAGTEVAPQPAPIPVPTPERPVVSERRPLALDDVTRVIRQMVGAVLDLADRAAEVISKRIEGRA
jgi:hypothetical protein